MSKIVLAWEMGGGFGHINRLHQIATALVLRGHDVTVLIDEHNTKTLLNVYLNGLTYDLAKAPARSRQPLKFSRKLASFSEVLLASSYHDINTLTTAIGSWHDALNALSPEVLLCDAAPTALLASRGQAWKVITIGDDFFAPPNHIPPPKFIICKDLTAASIEHSEQQLVHNINTALARHKLPKIQHTGDIFVVNENVLLTIAELDGYAAARNSGHYYGHIPGEAFATQSLQWTNTGSVKVFAYLKLEYPQLQAFFIAVNDLDIEARIFVPGISSQEIRNFSTDKIVISSEPYRLDSSPTPGKYSEGLHQANILVCHGGSVAISGVVNGVKILTIPLQQEQFITGQCGINANVGMGLNPHADKTAIKNKLEALIKSKHMARTLLDCKTKYATFEPQRVLDLVISAIERAANSD